MKQIVYILFLVSTYFSFAQVGIGTTSPQKDLHVAGTLRVEGLNSTNNGVNNGGTTLTAVSVDQNGNLKLTPHKPAFLVNGNIIPKTINKDANIDATGVLKAGSFTLDNDGLIEIIYGISVQLKKNGTNAFKDGSPRLVTVELYVKKLSDPIANYTLRSRATQVYTSEIGGAVASVKYIVLSGSNYIDLPAGAYSYKLEARCASKVIEVAPGIYDNRPFSATFAPTIAPADVKKYSNVFQIIEY